MFCCAGKDKQKFKNDFSGPIKNIFVCYILRNIILMLVTPTTSHCY